MDSMINEKMQKETLKCFSEKMCSVLSQLSFDVSRIFP